MTSSSPQANSRRSGARWIGAPVSLTLLMALTACGGNTNVGQSLQGQTPAAASATGSTSATIPAPFDTYTQTKGGACGFEKVANPAAERVGIAGWAVLDSKRGVLPEQVILKLEAGGKTQYVVPRRTQRQDVATYFKKPSLAGSGFVQVLPLPKADRPATVSALLAFNKKLLVCPVTLQLKAS